MIITRWLALVIMSGIFVFVLEYIHLPAALMLGPMSAGIFMSVTGRELKIPNKILLFSQGIIGCMIARGIPRAIFGEILEYWQIFLVGTIWAIVASTLIGWLMTRWQVIAGNSAIWGISPGAATAMVLMSADYGADIRMVAFMQYFRVVCVVTVASLVAHIWGTVSGVEIPAMVWFPPVNWIEFVKTLLLIVCGIGLTIVLRIPSGPLLTTLVPGIILQSVGLLTLELPPWFLAASYAFVGWNIGLRFTRNLLLVVFKSIPRVFAAIVALIAICGIFAWVVVITTDIDPLSAYLATSPGGADSMAIIAASGAVDMPFIMSMQTARLILVIICCPYIAKFIAKRENTQ